MIKIIAKHYVKPDQVNDFIALAKELVQKTNQNDAGCIHYGLFQHRNSPQILTFMEEWEDQESLDRHMASSHFQRIVPLFEDLLEKPGEVDFYHSLL